MERNVEFKGFEPPEWIRPLIDRLISRLERSSRRFPPELVHSRIMVEEHEARTRYSLSLTLDVPGKTLAAREEQHDMQAGIRAAFADIERQLEKHKANLRRDHWKRPERREEVREMKAEAASSAA